MTFLLIAVNIDIEFKMFGRTLFFHVIHILIDLRE